MYLSGFLLGLLTIGILKTLVMLFTLWLLWKAHQGKRGLPKANLWSLARAEHGVTYKFLVWGLLAFFVSEMTCGIEIYILMGPSPTLRLAHSYSSALGAGLLAYGTFMALDRRVLHYFDETRHCVLVPACRGCPRREGRTCKFHPVYVWSLCFAVMMAVPLLFIPVQELVADPADIALPFASVNAFFDQKVVPLLERHVPRWKHETMYFVIPREMSLADFRHIPIASVMLGLAALGLSFARKREELSFLLACLAVGPLMFAYLEAAVYALIPDVYIGALGHEAAELVGLALLRSVLYQLLGTDQ